MHNYMKTPGRPEICKRCQTAKIHPVHPHEFIKQEPQIPKGSETKCVCGMPLADKVHTMVMV